MRDQRKPEKGDSGGTGGPRAGHRSLGIRSADIIAYSPAAPRRRYDTISLTITLCHKNQLAGCGGRGPSGGTEGPVAPGIRGHLSLTARVVIVADTAFLRHDPVYRCLTTFVASTSSTTLAYYSLPRQHDLNAPATTRDSQLTGKACA